MIEFDPIEYCYEITGACLAVEFDELTDELHHYFKAIRRGDDLSILLHSDCIENLIGIRECDDIVSYVLNSYGYAE